MFNRFLPFIGFLVIAALLFVSPAEAKRTAANAPAVNVVIDISSQSMSVKVNGWYYGNWKVSTARPGYYTPRGIFRVQRTAKVYYSKKYDNAPMPNSVFFKGGYAIHGSYQVRSRGGPHRMAACGFCLPMLQGCTTWSRNMAQGRPGSRLLIEHLSSSLADFPHWS